VFVRRVWTHEAVEAGPQNCRSAARTHQNTAEKIIFFLYFNVNIIFSSKFHRRIPTAELISYLIVTCYVGYNSTVGIRR